MSEVARLQFVADLEPVGTVIIGRKCAVYKRETSPSRFLVMSGLTAGYLIDSEMCAIWMDRNQGEWVIT